MSVDKRLDRRPFGLLVSVRLRSSSTRTWHTYPLRNSNVRVFDSLLNSLADSCCRSCVCLWSLPSRHPRPPTCQATRLLRIYRCLDSSCWRRHSRELRLFLACRLSLRFAPRSHSLACSLPNRLVSSSTRLRSVRISGFHPSCSHRLPPWMQIHDNRAASGTSGCCRLVFYTVGLTGYHGR